MTEFKQALRRRIREKQDQYDALLANLSSGVLPPDVVADLGQRMQTIKAEIATLQATEPPQDFTADTIHAWLESIKAAPDRDVVRLLIERMDVAEPRSEQNNKTAFNVHSTLKTVLSNNGCGSSIAMFPPILFSFRWP